MNRQSDETFKTACSLAWADYALSRDPDPKVAMMVIGALFTNMLASIKEKDQIPQVFRTFVDIAKQVMRDHHGVNVDG